MKLYEVCDELAAIFDEYGEELEDLPEQLKPQLDALRMALDQKLSAIWALIKNSEAEADALSTEASRLQKAARARKNRALALKDYVAYCLGEGTRWKSPDGTREFTWRRSEAVEVQDEAAIPDCYCVFERRPLLNEIKKDIRSGATVPGAALVQRMNLQVK